MLLLGNFLLFNKIREEVKVQARRFDTLGESRSLN